jgi:hypothetical protein
MKTILALVFIALGFILINKSFDKVAPESPILIIGNTILGDSVIIDDSCPHVGPMVERVHTIAGQRVATRYGVEQYKRIFNLNSDGIFCWK